MTETIHRQVYDRALQMLNALGAIEKVGERVRLTELGYRQTVANVLYMASNPSAALAFLVSIAMFTVLLHVEGTILIDEMALREETEVRIRQIGRLDSTRKNAKH